MNQIKTLLFTFIILTFANTIKGQSSYSLSLKDASLTEIIDTISQLADCKFSFPSSLLKNNDRTDLSISGLELDKLLNQSFTDFDLEFSLTSSKTILLRKKNKVVEPAIEKTQVEKQITIRGHVKDNVTRAPIEYAAISIPKYNVVAFSDVAGKFELSVSKFKQSDEVNIHMLGYDAIYVSIDKFILSPNIELRAKPSDMPEITILEKVPHVILQQNKLSLTNRGLQNLGIGLAGNDVMRSIQMLPGIDASEDSSTDLKIRGSNADETLIILDGIPLYNTSHYYGIFSSINTDYVKKVNIYKNTQPIEYGNKTAGVVEFDSGNDIIESLSGKVNLNLLESSVMIDAPISANSFLSVSGRITLRDITNTSFNSIGERNKNFSDLNNSQTQNYSTRSNTIESEPEFNFWDMQAKYFLKVNSESQIQLNFFKSNDNFSNEIENRFFISRNQNRFITDEDTSISEKWNNTGIGLSWTSHLGKKLNLDINSYYSKYGITNATFSRSDFFGPNLDTVEETITNEQSQFNEVQDLGLNINLRQKINNTNMHSGLKLVQYNTEFEINFSEDLELQQKASAIEFTSYAEIDHTFSNSLNIAGGIRAHYFTGTKQLYFSPQISSSYTLNKHTTLKASIGKNHQFLRELSVESNFGNNIDQWVLADDNMLPVSNSINSMVGITFKKNKFAIDAELFYKKMNNITELSLASSRANDRANGMQGTMPPPPINKLFKGHGKSYGLDLLLSSEFRYVNTQIAYTLSKVQQSFNQVDQGRYFDAPNDKRHQLKIINDVFISDFSVGLNYTFTSGRVFTDLNKLADIDNFNRKTVNPREFKSRLPQYHRLDLSLSYTIKNQFTPIKVGVGVFNVLDRNNVKYQQQIQGTGIINNSALENIVLGTNSDLLDRTLNLNLTLEF